MGLVATCRVMQYPYSRLTSGPRLLELILVHGALLLARTSDSARRVRSLTHVTSWGLSTLKVVSVQVSSVGHDRTKKLYKRTVKPSSVMRVTAIYLFEELVGFSH